MYPAHASAKASKRLRDGNGGARVAGSTTFMTRRRAGCGRLSRRAAGSKCDPSDRIGGGEKASFVSAAGKSPLPLVSPSNIMWSIFNDVPRLQSSKSQPSFNECGPAQLHCNVTRACTDTRTRAHAKQSCRARYAELRRTALSELSVWTATCSAESLPTPSESVVGATGPGPGLLDPSGSVLRAQRLRMVWPAGLLFLGRQDSTAGGSPGRTAGSQPAQQEAGRC